MEIGQTLDFGEWSMQSRCMGEIAVNFVAFDESRDACLMVLVEEPWTASNEDHLSALQDRLYGCLEAALDGQLAEQFPESHGKLVIIRVDCYDVDRGEVDAFLGRFAEGIAALPEFSADQSPFVREYRFEVNHDTLDRPHRRTPTS